MQLENLVGKLLIELKFNKNDKLIDRAISFGQLHGKGALLGGKHNLNTIRDMIIERIEKPNH
jgi:hypothetical protein